MGSISFPEFRECTEAATTWIETYFRDIENYSITPDLAPGDWSKKWTQSVPEEGISLKQICTDFETQIVPGLTHWGHPGSFNYFNTSSSEPAILAEMFETAVNVPAMMWSSSPVATELEEVTLDWLRQWIGLEVPWFGMLHPSGSLSNFHALVAARQYIAPEYRNEGMQGNLIIYASEEAHSSIIRGAITAGFGANQVRLIETDDHYAMRPDQLRNTLDADLQLGLRPCCIVAAIGSTSSCAIDSLPDLVEIAEKYGVWLHADCAYGGALAIVPEYRAYFTGLERVHSFVINPHKWLFVPIECSALYTRYPKIFRDAFSYIPSYLETNDGAINYMDYGIALTRQFRALKLWFVMRAFGRKAIADKLREHMALCHWIAEKIDAHPSFELAVPVTMGLVCFRFQDSDTATQWIVDQLNQTQRFWLGTTQLNNQIIIRIAIGNLQVEKHHIEGLWQALEGYAETSHTP